MTTTTTPTAPTNTTNTSGSRLPVYFISHGGGPWP